MKRILVVDDEEDIRTLAVRTLVSVGIDVVSAIDGNEALRYMNEIDFDLVLLDYRMSNKNGLEVIQEMKKIDRLKGIPVILFSAFQSIKDEAIGVDDYLEKPFTRDEFLQKVVKYVSIERD
ncbi:response regulator [Candidatus Bathyarchaeota archaeon]|nr:response regulator [Candidatus Bathyarchaeota archaeon]MBT4424069.1 response regulator [Candidatus Bathyarchaeota archaeon]MBT6604044.1 response regulator [Candidatus Bathyarchaeota archaeon]MBT7188331.1 response regulator [Candidatus Bathyarchaeota archaeon]MBT7345931.1 response regulator [Candidatus Bathyarchaeota archaeon]